MENDSAPFMRSFLEALPLLEPRPTGISPRISGIPEIRAVLFDIYGTLLISASGDVDVVQFREEAVVEAFKAGHIEIPPEASTEKAARQSVFLFKTVIEEMHRNAKRSGIPYPEVDIVEVWQETVSRLREEGAVRVFSGTDYERCSFVFEILCNPVGAMPGLKDLLDNLERESVHLGLVSNAQFFTPPILSYFVSGTIKMGRDLHPFDPNLTVYSYRHLRAKPDPYLFELARKQLALLHVAPTQTLYIGNDMLNDVWAASQVGFRTVLFAGDARSLRLREDKLQTRNLSPDAVITDLNQLFDLLE